MLRAMNRETEQDNIDQRRQPEISSKTHADTPHPTNFHVTADEYATQSLRATLPTTAAIGNLPLSLRNHSRYQVLRELGRGGMGEVYLAEHRSMGRMVALKTIRQRTIDSPESVDRFFREIRAMGALNHPNVVVAHDAEATADCLFLVMEFLEGCSLDKLVGETQGLDPRLACNYIVQAAIGLRHAHQRGVIHRDIKPSNLFLIPDETGVTPGQIKILDFGLAKIVGNRSFAQTPVGYAMGTKGFMSPQQATDARAVGINADIFSLGRTLYTLLTSQYPYPNGSTATMPKKKARIL
jgi:serine/threonine protein kinase